MESSSSVDCGHGETGDAEKDWSLSMSAPKSEVCLQEHGLSPPEDWVCLSSNTEKDYSQTEEEGKEQPVVSTQSLTLCDNSQGEQSGVESESITVGILPPASFGKQAEETDRQEAVIQEGQDATKGKDTLEQEAENSISRRREEEANSESIDLIRPSGESKALIMGQCLSSESSNSETEGFQEREIVKKEEMKLSQELCDGLSLEDGLTDPVSTPEDVPNPSLIDCGDVIEGPESAVPHLLIEGLHEGEPPSDINSLEQNQETAVWDYAMEQECCSAPRTGCHSGNCSETTSVKELGDEHGAEPCLKTNKPDSSDIFQTVGNSMEDIQAEPLYELMPNYSSSHADLDSELTHGVSSDDDCSFKSVGSSTTEIFHPIKDNVGMEDQESLETRMSDRSSTEFKWEQPNDSKSDQNGDHLPTLDAGLPSEPGTDSALTDCSQLGIQSDSQLLSSLQTMEALNTDGTEEELDPEPSKEDLLLCPDSESAPTVEVNESESGEPNDSELYGGVENLESEVSSKVLIETSSFVAETCEVIWPGEGEHQPAETGNKSATDAQLVQEDPKQDNLEMTVDKGLMASVNQTDVTSSQGVIPLSADADFKMLEIEPLSLNNEVSQEPLLDNERSENPKILDNVDGASQSAIQGGQTIISLTQIMLILLSHAHRSQGNKCVLFLNKCAFFGDY